MNCNQCQSTNPASANNCGNCGMLLVSNERFQRPSSPSAGGTVTQSGYEAPQQSVALDSLPVKLAAGESLVRSYRLTRRKGPLGSVTTDLHVTDTRVLYSSETKNVLNQSRFNQDFQVKDVSGVTTGTSRGLTPLGCVLTFVSALFGLFLLTVSPVFGLLWLLAVGGTTYMRTRSTDAVLMIQLRDVGEPLVVLGGATRTSFVTKVFSLLLPIASPVLRVLDKLGISSPEGGTTATNGPDADRMCEELGALLLEVQNRGALAHQDSAL